MEVILPAHGHISAALLHSRQADKKELVFFACCVKSSGKRLSQAGKAGGEGGRETGMNGDVKLAGTAGAARASLSQQVTG